MQYLDPIDGAPPDSPFSRPTAVAVPLRCTVCHSIVCYVLSNGTLQLSGGHDNCGVFDTKVFEAAKGRVAPKYREYKRTRVKQTAVPITPSAAHDVDS
jgi:hypothetical protein